MVINEFIYNSRIDWCAFICIPKPQAPQQSQNKVYRNFKSEILKSFH